MRVVVDVVVRVSLIGASTAEPMADEITRCVDAVCAQPQQWLQPVFGVVTGDGVQLDVQQVECAGEIVGAQAYQEGGEVVAFDAKINPVGSTLSMEDRVAQLEELVREASRIFNFEEKRQWAEKAKALNPRIFEAGK